MFFSYRLVFTLLLLLAPAYQASAQGLFVDGSFSGSWFDPQRSGEGWVLQILEDDRAFVAWFTYPPASKGGSRQAWLIGTGVVQGERVVFENLQQFSGTVFGQDFNPNDVVASHWGSLEIQFTDCSNATLAYEGPDSFGAAVRSVDRLTNLNGLPCTNPVTRKGDTLRPISSAWFDPSHNGEGWFLEGLAEDRVNMYWFTYDEQGNATWISGIGSRSGDLVTFEQVFLVTGPVFGDGFDPATVMAEFWGSLTFELLECGRSVLNYDSVLPTFGSGTLNPERLTELDLLTCLDPPQHPTEPLNAGTWRAIAASPTPRSEVSATVLDGRAYLSGGFGGPRVLESYDPSSDSWAVHPDMPAGKNHHMVVAHKGEIYVFGGFSEGSFASTTSAFVFNPGNEQWRQISDLTIDFTSANTAISIDDSIYIVGGTGFAPIVYDPGSDSYQLLPRPSVASRDHSTSVLFDGEIWLLGGRNVQVSELAAVEIFDPVSKTWRNGPSLTESRSGFGAAVVQGQIMVAGGELISGGNLGLTLDSFEVYAPSRGQFVRGPDMPAPLHGVALVSIDDKLLVLGGANIAGSIAPAGQYFLYEPAIAKQD